jgi:ABC-type bacteriocin/lantibiotic exporter with double-glycine peptidase domain
LKTLNYISLKQLLTDNKNYLFLGLLLLIINKAATMLIPATGKFLIDDVIQNHDIGLLKKILIAILVSLILQASTSFLLIHLLGIKAQKKIAEIRTLFFNKITHLPLSYFKDTSSGAITSRVLSDFDSIRILLGSGIVQLAGGLLSVCFTLVLMVILNSKLTLLTITPLALFCILLYLIYKKQKPAFKTRKLVRANASANLIEAFRGIKIIKGFVSNEYATEIIQKDFFKLFKSIKKTLISGNLMISSAIFFIGLTSLLVMWFGSNMAINNELTVGELTTFTMYLAFLIAPVYQITKITSQFTDANASIERINETLSLENENINIAQEKIELTGAIQFKNVSFQYGSKYVLENLNFNILPNSINAIVGKSGSGKTTLTELIASFYLPSSGEILIDQHPLSSLNISHYRKQLGFVFQETYLFNGTIKENILLSNPFASDQELNKAMDSANVSEFLPDLPDGVNTIVGENGNKLSAGQKQRIAISRAFLTNPKILILDEVTSNLDAYNEQLITESIQKLIKNRTIIIIAHRLQTIKNADQIILLDDGKIHEQGSHNNLMNKQDKYYNLYNSYF